MFVWVHKHVFFGKFFVASFVINLFTCVYVNKVFLISSVTSLSTCVYMNKVFLISSRSVTSLFARVYEQVFFGKFFFVLCGNFRDKLVCLCMNVVSLARFVTNVLACVYMITIFFIVFVTSFSCVYEHVFLNKFLVSLGKLPASLFTHVHEQILLFFVHFLRSSACVYRQVLFSAKQKCEMAKFKVLWRT